MKNNNEDNLKTKFINTPRKEMDENFWKKFHNEFSETKEESTPWYQFSIKQISFAASAAVILILLINVQKNSFEKDLLLAQSVQDDINFINFLANEDSLDQEVIHEEAQLELTL